MAPAPRRARAPGRAVTATFDDSPDARAHPPLAGRAPAHRRLAEAHGGRIRARRVLRVLAVSRLPHDPGHRLRVSAESESRRRAAWRLLEPADCHCAVLRVRDDDGDARFRPPAAARVRAETDIAVRALDFYR